MNPDIKFILQSALQAPSADNTQPWEVSVDDMAVSLFHIPNRDVMQYDTGLRASLLSHGAFIEHFCIAAAYLEYEVTVQTFNPTPSNDWLVARFEIHKSLASVDSTEKALYAQIENRCTNRKPYSVKKLSQTDKEILKSVNKKLGWGSIRILDNPQKELVAAAASAGQIMFQNEYVHSGLFEHIRWTRAELESTRDGFSIESFELPPPAKLIFSLARSKKRLNFLNKFLKLSQKIPSGMAQSFSKSGGYIAITSNSRTPLDYIQAGRIMDRLWLAGTALDLSFHPIGALLFFKDAIDAGTTTVYSEEEKLIVEKSYSTLQRSFSLEDTERILFLFRVGYAEKPTNKTLRYQLTEIVR